MQAGRSEELQTPAGQRSAYTGLKDDDEDGQIHGPEGYNWQMHRFEHEANTRGLLLAVRCSSVYACTHADRPTERCATILQDFMEVNNQYTFSRHASLLQMTLTSALV